MYETPIAHRYKIENEINCGAFGKVFKGHDQQKEESVAIKIENIGSPPSLKHEVKILTYLQTNKIKKIPSIFWYGIYQKAPCLVMTYYECSLYDYIFQSNTLSIEKINNWVYQLIDILEQIHNAFLLHRDIKPQNIMIKGDSLYFIDFGLSTFYINENREHILDNISENSIIGSLKFASIFIHRGHRYSRRDDLISIIYIYAFIILGGKAPWFSNEIEIVGNNKEKEIFITFLEDAIEQFNLIPFLYYLEYCYQLSYDETPNYNAMKQLFAQFLDVI